jgi:hypothetical protein
VRTTVTIDDRLLKQAKLAATRSGRTLSELVEDGLRLLMQHSGPRQRSQVSLPTFGGSGVRPGVDLEDKDALAALLGDEASAHAAG